MGVTMSKADQSGPEMEDGKRVTDQSGCSETEDGKFEAKCKGDKNQQLGSLANVGSRPLQQKSVVHDQKSPCPDSNMTHIMDDTTGDDVSHDLCQTLQANIADDLHIANTRFFRHKPIDPTFGPEFTSDPDITSVSEFTSASTSIQNSAKLMSRPAAPIPPPLQEDIGIDASTVSHLQGNAENDKNVPKGNNRKIDTVNQGIEVPLYSRCKTERRSSMTTNLLTIPEDGRKVHSPVPMLGQDDTDLDPFEGMDIPRERVCSFGSSSIYSVKEISDRLYQEYFYEVRNSIRNYGFFEKFPTPTVVSDAQRAYRQMEIPTPADEEGNILPYPPKITKQDVFASMTESFTEVDQRIVHVPEKIQKSTEMADIVSYLCSGLDDDLSKVRAITTWIAIRQIQAAGDGANKQLSSEDWCKKFRAMCRYSRIKSKLVTGVIRSHSYIPGDDLDLHKGIWVSVLVNSTWWLVDPVIDNWESVDMPKGQLNSEYNTSGEHSSLFRHAESFFRDPEQFIFTHYPDEEYWQLLARPVSREEFAELAVLSRGFFSLRMKLISPAKSTIFVNKEETVVTVGYPENTLRQFKGKLWLCENNQLSENTRSRASLRHFVFLEPRIDTHRLNAYIKLPQKGTFFLALYGCSESQSWQKLCSYRLVNNKEVASSAYPVNNREEWGPGYDTLRLGLRPISHQSGDILVSSGVVQVAFKDPKCMEFRHELLKDDGRVCGDSDSSTVSVLRDGENDIVFILDIQNRIQGTFVLKLFAKSRQNKHFQNFCNYLVKKVEEEKKLVIPRFQFNHVEVQEKSRVTNAPRSGQLQLVVNASGFSQLVVDLKLHDRQEMNFSEHARHWIEDDQGFIDLNFPRKGEYSLKILGRNIATNHFQTLREERIRVDIPSPKWSPFPKTESSWSSFYKIEQPLTHHLPEKEYIQFTVAIKEAHDVAVLSPNGWHHLNRHEDGTWDGQSWTGPKSTKCRLLARFEIGSEKFTDLLWFKIMAEDDFDSMEERQENVREEALKIHKKIDA